MVRARSLKVGEGRRASSSGARRILIRSENNDFQRAEVLKRNREKRHRYGEFLLEGVRALSKALEYGWEFRSIYCAAGVPLSDWALNLIERSRVPVVYELQGELIEKLSDKEESSELLAVIAIPADTVDRLPVNREMLTVVFDRPANPGNLGSSIRSCDAFGATGVVITGHATDLYHPHAVRGTMGSLFALPAVRMSSHHELLSWISEVKLEVPDIRIVGTSEKGAEIVDRTDLTGPLVVVLGNETWGMSAAYEQLCDCTVRIPMHGAASSLNVSCATTVVLYEIARQRRR